MMQWIAQYWMQVFFGLVTTVTGALWRYWYKQQKKHDAQQEALVTGMQAVLRDRIIQAYNNYMEMGYCPINSLENVHQILREYKNLNGDGNVVDELVEQLDKLPHTRGLPKEAK